MSSAVAIERPTRACSVIAPPPGTVHPRAYGRNGPTSLMQNAMYTHHAERKVLCTVKYHRPWNTCVGPLSSVSGPPDPTETIPMTLQPSKPSTFQSQTTQKRSETRKTMGLGGICSDANRSTRDTKRPKSDYQKIQSRRQQRRAMWSRLVSPIQARKPEIIG